VPKNNAAASAVLCTKRSKHIHRGVPTKRGANLEKRISKETAAITTKKKSPVKVTLAFLSMANPKFTSYDSPSYLSIVQNGVKHHRTKFKGGEE